MIRLNVLKVPDYRLRLVSSPVEAFSKDIQSLVTDMLLTMNIEGGIGLSAPQVNVQKRIVVIQNDPFVLINPIILSKEGEVVSEEGCLSIPGVLTPVSRAKSIKVYAQTIEGSFFEFTVSDLPALVIQHEIDHLDGKLIFDFS